MMSPRVVVLTFISAVAAVVAGFIGGGLVHEVVGSGHEVAVGVVDAQAGAPIATSSPTPTPSPDGSFEPCPGTPPRDGCECRERRKNSRWVCPLM